MRKHKLIVAVFLIVFVAVIALGVSSKVNQPQQETIVLKPYTGAHYSVLKHGTVLKEPYKDPSSISGTLDINGVWIIEGQK